MRAYKWKWTPEHDQILQQYIEENPDMGLDRVAAAIQNNYPHWGLDIGQIHHRVTRIKKTLNDAALILEKDTRTKSKIAGQSTKVRKAFANSRTPENGPVISYNRDPQEFLNDLPSNMELRMLPSDAQVRLLNNARKYHTNKRIAEHLGISLSQLTYLFKKLGIYSMRKKEKKEEAHMTACESRDRRVPEGFFLSYKGEMSGIQLANRLLKTSEFVEESTKYRVEILLVELESESEEESEDK